MDFNPLPSLEDNNTTLSLKKGGILYGWLATEETSCTNYSITVINVDNSTLYTEFNECVFISIPIIEGTFENDYIYILRYL